MMMFCREGSCLPVTPLARDNVPCQPPPLFTLHPLLGVHTIEPSGLLNDTVNVPAAALRETMLTVLLTPPLLMVSEPVTSLVLVPLYVTVTLVPLLTAAAVSVDGDTEKPVPLTERRTG